MPFFSSAFFAVGIVFGMLLFAVLPGRLPRKGRNYFYGRYIANRGLFNKDQTVPENSMAAFRAAAEQGYAIALPVQLTKDGALAVFHDKTLQRVCGENRRLEECTAEDLAALRLFETDERIPSLEEVLTLAGQNTPLLIELRDSHDNEKLCKLTLALLRSFQQAGGEVAVQSINPALVAWYKTNGRDIMRGLKTAPQDYLAAGGKLQAFLISHMFLNAVCRPQFVNFRASKENFGVSLFEKLGGMLMVWTLEDALTAAGYEVSHDAILFQAFAPPPRFKEKLELLVSDLPPQAAAKPAETLDTSKEGAEDLQKVEAESLDSQPTAKEGPPAEGTPAVPPATEGAGDETIPKDPLQGGGN